MSWTDFLTGGSGGGLLGGLISGASSFFGGQNAAQSQANSNAQNLAFAMDAAHNGIQWKVADARAAGINPLAALGAPTFSPGAISVGSDAAGKGIAGAGQDISRAIQSTLTKEDRDNAIANTRLTLEGKQLDNDIKRAEFASQMAKINQAGNTPPHPALNQIMDIGGQAPTIRAGTSSTAPIRGSVGTSIQDEPQKRTIMSDILPGTVVGAVPGWQFTRTPTGVRMDSSPDFQKASSNDTMGNLQSWLYRQLYMIGHGSASRNVPKPVRDLPLPPGYYWGANVLAGEWQPYESGSGSDYGYGDRPLSVSQGIRIRRGY